MLITVPRKDTSIRIVAYDDVFCELLPLTLLGVGREPSWEDHEKD